MIGVVSDVSFRKPAEPYTRLQAFRPIAQGPNAFVNVTSGQRGRQTISLSRCDGRSPISIPRWRSIVFALRAAW